MDNEKAAGLEFHLETTPGFIRGSSIWQTTMEQTKGKRMVGYGQHVLRTYRTFESWAYLNQLAKSPCEIRLIGASGDCGRAVHLRDTSLTILAIRA
jgi:hypothetical protein